MFDVLEMPWDISDPTRIGGLHYAPPGPPRTGALGALFLRRFWDWHFDEFLGQWLKGNEGNFGQDYVLS